MMRDLHFPTPIYIFDHNDPSLNVQLEKDIVAWSNQGIVTGKPHY